MKRLFILSLAAALVGLAIAPPAFAGIGGSRHDMTNATVGTKYAASLATFDKYGSCSACHIPHGAGGARLFPKSVSAPGTGFFGPLCQTCHDTSVATHTDLNTNSTVLNAAHGLSITTLTALGTHQTVATSGLDYTGSPSPAEPIISAGSIECLSCHDVHNQNSFRPFLAVSLDNLCESCHSNRVNNSAATTGWSNNAGGSGATHPAGPVFTGDLGGIATPVASNSPIYNLATRLTQNPDVAPLGSTWTDTIWNSGMHLSGQGAFGTGGVDCVTCHTVHWDENDATPNNGTSYLASVDDGAPTAVNNQFCEYCHRGTAVAGYTAPAGVYPNPGATSYTHPNDGYSGGNATILNVSYAWQPSVSSPLAGTGTSTLVCTSCHGIHPQSATSQTQLNTPVLLNYGAAGSVCNACHTQTGAYAATFYHHPVGTGVYATSGNTAGNVTCAGGNVGLGVNACHGSGGGTANGGWMAHNRTSALGNPGTTLSVKCMNCHSNNPSNYTVTTPYTASGSASHFVGDAEAATWANGRSTEVSSGTIRYANAGTSAAGTANTTNWSGSGLPSYFGTNASTITCESCHRLAAGNIRSGDGATNMLVEVVGSAVDGGDPPYAYATSPYLCSGCHLIPGGTHPLAAATPSAYAIGAAGRGLSYTAAGLNCESCHSTHDAATTSGSYILDGTTAGTYGTGVGMDVEPTIDYTLFCAVCHGSFQ